MNGAGAVARRIGARVRAMMAGMAAAAMLLATAAACGGKDGTAPANGTLLLAAGNTCPSAHVAISVDGGAETEAALVAGQTIQSFTLGAGTHIVRARMLDASGGWSPLSVTIVGGRTTTAVLQCP